MNNKFISFIFLLFLPFYVSSQCGELSIFAGQYDVSGSQNGATFQATFDGLRDIDIGPDGAIYVAEANNCLLYTSPSPRDATLSRMPSSA